MAWYDEQDSIDPKRLRRTARMATIPPPIAETRPPAYGSTPVPKIPISPSFTPDWKALIQADPGYLDFNRTADAPRDAGASRQAALRTLAIRCGGLPTGCRRGRRNARLRLCRAVRVSHLSGAGRQLVSRR
jgi:hypothetical protein